MINRTSSHMHGRCVAPGGEITTSHPQQPGLHGTPQGHPAWPRWSHGVYDVRALFTSVPIQPALKIIEKLLKEDTGLQNRTAMSIKHSMDLLEFCLRSTYFTYQGKYYEQVEGAAMGSPISQIVANLYMENFELRALNTSPNAPLMWKRFVDDTFVVMKKAHKEEFLTHLNSMDNNIQFTTEEPRPDGSLPFLDILITPEKDGNPHWPVHALGQSSHNLLKVQCSWNTPS